ncbi:Gfo/Idh/MocA family protein [Sodalis sp. C49]|uniref:Gfo/Idh/MocA family protein n=1 Tax=Sodalis sp. C49 TaxID=3228929 RepID=UPI003965B50F
MVIGTGFAEAHIQWIQESNVATVAALGYMNNPSRAKKIATQYGIPLISNNPLDIIDSGKIDAISIVTPPDTHEHFIIPSLNKNLLVISDKPLAHSAAAAKSLAEKVRQTGGNASITFQWRTHPVFKRLRELCHSPELGALVHIDLQFYHDFLAGPSTLWSWRHNSKQSGAGTLGDQGVHLFDLLRYITSDEWHVSGATKVIAWPQRNAGSIPISCNTDDIADVLLANDRTTAKARILTSRVCIGRREIYAQIQGTLGSANITVNPDTGAGKLAYIKISDPKIHSESFNNSGNIYRLIVGNHQNNVKQAEVANFDDGYAAQILLEEALLLAE